MSLFAQFIIFLKYVLKACISTPSCEYYTYYPSDGRCFLYSDCTLANCPEACISGQPDCDDVLTTQDPASPDEEDCIYDAFCYNINPPFYAYINILSREECSRVRNFIINLIVLADFFKIKKLVGLTEIFN